MEGLPEDYDSKPGDNANPETPDHEKEAGPEPPQKGTEESEADTEAKSQQEPGIPQDTRPEDFSQKKTEEAPREKTGSQIPEDSQPDAPQGTEGQTQEDNEEKPPAKTEPEIPKDTEAETPQDAETQAQEELKSKISQETKLEDLTQQEKSPEKAESEIPKDTEAETLQGAETQSQGELKPGISQETKLEDLPLQGTEEKSPEKAGAEIPQGDEAQSQEELKQGISQETKLEDLPQQGTEEKSPEKAESEIPQGAETQAQEELKPKISQETKLEDLTQQEKAPEKAESEIPKGTEAETPQDAETQAQEELKLKISQETKLEDLTQQEKSPEKAESEIPKDTEAETPQDAETQAHEELKPRISQETKPEDLTHQEKTPEEAEAEIPKDTEAETPQDIKVEPEIPQETKFEKERPSELPEVGLGFAEDMLAWNKYPDSFVESETESPTKALESVGGEVRKWSSSESTVGILSKERLSFEEAHRTSMKFHPLLAEDEKETFHRKKSSKDTKEIKEVVITETSSEPASESDIQEKPKKPETTKTHYLTWSPEDVAEWISQLGFPQYKECFTTNFISGRKLIHVNCSNLPQMGITDFEDMKVISRHTRELLGIEEPLFSRSISLPYRDNMGLFLERKGHTGVKSDALTLCGFIEEAGLQEYVPKGDKKDDPCAKKKKKKKKRPMAHAHSLKDKIKLT
ncbi:sterile alpha motif domain-containing protein 15 [Gracilinanus agilis]|uniref:sterile alpha motif domain-containing protein 15 n=1 Tax=Gracilinanus agilis TaxID=191870 RepID=UPI001CFF086D|nr:sterile alpha motif domain-containing protein 15 [Gracilinanus agilis]